MTASRGEIDGGGEDGAGKPVTKPFGPPEKNITPAAVFSVTVVLQHFHDHAVLFRVIGVWNDQFSRNDQCRYTLSNVAAHRPPIVTTINETLQITYSFSHRFPSPNHQYISESKRFGRVRW